MLAPEHPAWMAGALPPCTSMLLTRVKLPGEPLESAFSLLTVSHLHDNDENDMESNLLGECVSLIGLHLRQQQACPGLSAVL